MSCEAACFLLGTKWLFTLASVNQVHFLVFSSLSVSSQDITYRCSLQEAQLDGVLLAG
jgi:hypothetical protein